MSTHLPLTPLTFAVLTTLAQGPRNGYGIVRGIEEGSDGTLSPGTGTVYVALQRLMGQGLLEAAPEPADAPSDRRSRRWYALTPQGRRVLTLEARRLSGALKLAVEAGVLDAREVGKG
jgi:DNA-binding PadR family transcriptional regulator